MDPDPDGPKPSATLIYFMTYVTCVRFGWVQMLHMPPATNPHSGCAHFSTEELLGAQGEALSYLKTQVFVWC
jgi:hypothetical protein